MSSGFRIGGGEFRFRGGLVDEEVTPVVREKIVEDERHLDFRRDVVHVAVRVLPEIPPDDAVVFLLQGPKSRLADVDAPVVRGEAEARVERDRLRAHLQHRGERRRILRDLRSVRGERIGAQLERARALERGHRPVARDPDGLRVAEFRMGRGESREVLHGSPMVAADLSPWHQ